MVERREIEVRQGKENKACIEATVGNLTISYETQPFGKEDRVEAPYGVGRYFEERFSKEGIPRDIAREIGNKAEILYSEMQATAHSRLLRSLFEEGDKE